MAATATITCPECHKTFKGRSTLDGKRVRCPRCEEPFLVRLGDTLKVDRGAEEEEEAEVARPAAKKVRPAAPAQPEPEAPPSPPEPAAATAPPAPGLPNLDPDDEEDANPYGVTTIDLRPRCPNCSNPLESDEAVVCLHCGYNTTTRAAVRTKTVVATTRQDVLVWMMPGLLCLAGIVALVLLALFYSVVMPGMFGDSFFVHESLRMWLTIILLGIMWPLGRYVIKRLILEPVPPEFVKDEG